MNDEDKDIVEMYFQRDENAVVKTSDKYGNRLFCMAQNMLSSAEDAHECVNDTYMKVWNAIPPARPQYFYAFLSKICRNICLNRIEYQNAKIRKAELVELTKELENCLPSSDRLEDNDSGDIAAEISAFLRKLPEQKRVIFIRRYWYSDFIAQIAERMQLKESSVKVTLHRTRKELKKFLENGGYKL